MDIYVGIDIGGTWIKGAFVRENFFTGDAPQTGLGFTVKKVRSPLSANSNPQLLVEVLNDLIEKLNIKPSEIKAIGISTAGIVDYAGTKVIKSAPHLDALKNEGWKVEVEQKLRCKACLINDADAAAIGLAELGYLKGNKTIGIMPVGTGLGFSVWKNGRRWRPGKSYPLLGSIDTPGGRYDSIASVSKLAALEKKDGDLTKVLSHPSSKNEKERYIRNLVKIINSTAILYSLDEVFVCGGLAGGVHAAGFPMEDLLNEYLQKAPDELSKPVKATIAREGNQLQLLGAIALAKGELIAFNNKRVPDYEALKTEIPYKKEIRLEEMPTGNIIEVLWKSEQEAGALLKGSLAIMEVVVDESVRRVNDGGRIIYVRSGTSGRIATMDAVEIPCTYGFPEESIIGLIAGGISDAAIEIESDFEEDASAVPEMLLLNINSKDIVIGISASGAAYYVQSALAFAKARGALSVQIQAALQDMDLPFCDHVIPLLSGNEVVAGSTRMKAGTATKKTLNFLSSAIMIKLGKVAGSYMVDVACINNKLVERAQGILKILFDIDKEEAMTLLLEADMDLNRAIRNIKMNKRKI
ncbi:MAG: N-acetylmuramic acid 6-phosphate etherase [Cytophagales bacterium]|nr:N-acetylmuramic acid 6-phosphate etherase [Cytophagales bacterium]